MNETIVDESNDNNNCWNTRLLLYWCHRFRKPMICEQTVHHAFHLVLSSCRSVMFRSWPGLCLYRWTILNDVHGRDLISDSRQMTPHSFWSWPQLVKVLPRLRLWAYVNLSELASCSAAATAKSAFEYSFSTWLCLLVSSMATGFCEFALLCCTDSLNAVGLHVGCMEWSVMTSSMVSGQRHKFDCWDGSRGYMS